MTEIIMCYDGDGEDFYNYKRVSELVRCRDCMYYETGKAWSPYCCHPDGLDDAKETDFCSKGEKKCLDL